MKFFSLVCCLAMAAGSVPAAAGTLFFEPFDVDVAADPAAIGFTTQYPQLSVSFPGTVAVVDGVLRTTGSGMQVTTPGVGEEAIVSGDVGAEIADADYWVGFVIGQNNIVFRPGSTSPRGSLAVEGPGGFSAQDVGFVPQASVLHRLEVHQRLDGLFTIRLSDGNDPATSFQATFFNPSSVGGNVGFHRAGPTNGDALYDNLRIESVPEPSSLLLALLSASAVWKRGRSPVSRGRRSA